MGYNQINYLMRCISAELVKTRRTTYLLGVFVMPTILAFLNLILMLGMSQENVYTAEQGWTSFAHNTLSFWSMLVLPGVVVLVTAFSAQQEHTTKCWRALMCLPIPKSAVYVAKLVVVAGLVLLSCLVLWGEDILFGWLLSLLRPETGLSLMHLNPLALLQPFLLMFILSMLIQAIHFWFSMRVQSMVMTIGVGFMLCLLGAFLHDEAVWRVVFPWCLPSLVRSAGGWLEGATGLLYSAAAGLLVLYLGCRDFSRRDVLV